MSKVTYTRSIAAIWFRVLAVVVGGACASSSAKFGDKGLGEELVTQVGVLSVLVEGSVDGGIANGNGTTVACDGLRLFC